MAADATGNGYVGSYRSVSPGVVGALDPDTDTSASFAGGTDLPSDNEVFIGTPSGLDFSNGDFSVETWVRTWSAADQTIIAQNDSVKNAPIWTLFIDDGIVKSRIYDDQWTQNGGGPDVDVNDGTWHHVVAVFDRLTTQLDPTRTLIYVDGEVVETIVRAPTPPDPPPGDPVFDSEGITIGDGSGILPLSGELDEVAVYPALLPAGRVAAHFEAGTSGPTRDNEPILTAEEDAGVRAIASADPRVAQLLAGRGSSISSVDPWTTAAQHRAMGAWITFAWSGPATLETDWPGINYDISETTSPPYTEGVMHYVANNVTELDVVVDLDCGRVVAIDPGPDPEVVESSVSSVSGPTQPAPCGGGSVMTAPPDTPKAWVRNLRVISLGPDAFRNYDFTQPSLDAPLGWPVTALFWNEANRENTNLYGFGGQDEYGQVNQGNGWEWITSDGSKTTPGRCGTVTHIREYQSPMPRFNPYYGYFVIGTTHLDHDENLFIGGSCPFGKKWSGNSQAAEMKVANRSEELWGPLAVKRDSIWFNNKESPHWQGSKFSVNSGRATKIKVCMTDVGTAIHCTSSRGLE